MNRVLLSSKNMCWGTPQDFFDELDSEFHFVLDPAATDKTAKCSLYYTPEMVVIYNGKKVLTDAVR